MTQHVSHRRSDEIAQLNGRVGDLEAELAKWRQVTDAVRELRGLASDWPDHGNAPLAITASYALMLREQEVAAYKIERLQSALSDIENFAATTPWKLTAKTMQNIAREALDGESP